MDCDRIESLISAEIDGEIAAADAAVLAEHLESCETCRALASECREQDRELRDAFADRRRAADALSARLAAAFESRRAAASHMSRTVAALVVGFALGWVVVKLAGDGATPGVPESPSFARVAFATGPVDVRADGDSEWKPAAADARLSSGSWLRCAPETLCEIAASDGSTIRLDRGTEARFVAPRSWELERGRMGSSVARAAEPFTVKVADSRVVALGTRFDVVRTGAAPSVFVFEGATRVETPAEVRVVRRGERAELGERVRIEALQQAQAALAASWANSLLALSGRDPTELEHRLDELLASVGKSKMSLLVEEEIRALGPSCVVPLTRYIASPRSQSDPGQRRRAARLVADLATERSVDALVGLLADPDPEVRQEMASGLERLTGLDQGLPPPAWKTPDWAACEPAYLRWREWRESRSSP